MIRGPVPRLRRTLMVLATALATVAATLTVATAPVATPRRRTTTAAPTCGCGTCRSTTRRCSATTVARPRRSWSRTPTPPLSTGTRQTSPWRPAPPRSWSRARSARHGTSWYAAWAGCSVDRHPWRRSTVTGPGRRGRGGHPGEFTAGASLRPHP
ncbi:hypothetical protein NKG94_15195 [Micromonospora sp. M12]